MTEWWTYRPSDFLLFSPRVYFRLFELHNEALWPAPVLTLALGAAILAMLVRPPRAGGRTVFAILGVLWLWVAWAFFWNRYAGINWAAPYVAPAFALQGLALLWFGAARGGLTFAPARRVTDYAALALLAFALFGYPLLAVAYGRPWRAAEVFGIAPDPTAIATLAVLALARDRLRWLLMVVPCLWCAASGATLWTMDAAGFWVSPLAAGAALALAATRRPD
jgi:hypothetical protein